MHLIWFAVLYTNLFNSFISALEIVPPDPNLGKLKLHMWTKHLVIKSNSFSSTNT